MMIVCLLLISFLYHIEPRQGGGNVHIAPSAVEDHHKHVSIVKKEGMYHQSLC